MHKLSLLVLLIAVSGMIAALWVSDHAFENIPYLEDELAYAYQAQLFANGDAYLDEPDADLRRMFWKPFVINCNSEETEAGLNCEGKLFGKYPPGWPIVLTLGYWMGMSWVINPLIFMVSIALTYRLGGEIFDRRVGAIAALLLAASPIAWIQSGSFMSHSWAMLLVLVFFFAMWRLEHKPHWLWGIVAGVALGWFFATRPLTATSLVAPMVVYSLLRIGGGAVQSRRTVQLLWWQRLAFLLALVGVVTIGAAWAVGQLNDSSQTTYPNWPSWPVLVVGGLIAIQITWFVLNPPADKQNPPFAYGFRSTLLPLIGLGIMAIGIGSSHFAYNAVTTGDPTQNLYVLVWDYDRIGFGEGHGRRGHSWERAKRNLNWDVDCYARDLFGWVELPDNAPDQPVTGNRCAVGADNQGLSWILLPFALVLGWRKRWLWLMSASIVAVVLGTMLYWINAGDYSARYYYEFTGLLAIISAVGAVYLADLVLPLKIDTGVYLALMIMVASAAVGYNPERIERIARMTEPHRMQLAEVETIRNNTDQPVLIISYGEYDTWREISVLMALTSPYLDSEYVLARDRYDTEGDRLLDMFPEHEVIYHVNGEFWRERPAELDAVGYLP